MQEVPVEKPLMDTHGSLGAALRDAREACGLSIHKAAENMHVSDDIIEALEQDNFAHLGAPIFVRGHLRNYARILGLPEDEVLAAEHTADKLASPPLITQRPGDSFGSHLAMPVFSIIVVSALMILGVVWWRHHLTNQPAALLTVHAATAKETAARAPQGPGIAADLVKHNLALPLKPVTAPTSAPKQTSGIKPAAVTVVRANSGQIAVHETGVIPPAQLTHAQFSLSQSSWIEIYDASGKRLYYDLAPAGDTLNVSGAGPLQVFLGNAPGVSIELNGTPFNQTPYTHPDNTARFRLGGTAGNSGQAG